MVDWVVEREKQRQIEEDIRRIKAQQQQESLRRISTGEPLVGKVSSSRRRISLTPEETKKVSILYTGQDRIEVKPGIPVEQAVRKRRAEDVVKKVQVKETLKALGRPEGYTYSLAQTPTKLDIRRTTRQEVERDTTYKDKELITPGFESRIKKLQEREQRLGAFKQATYERLGIERKKEDTYLTGFLKTAGQFPFELGSLPIFLGGRVAFSVEAFISGEPGRREVSPVIMEQGKLKFGQVVGKTGTTVAQSYDIRKPEGLFNIALTAVAVKSIGKARVKARQKPTFVTEELVAKRVTSKGFTIDEPYIDVEAVLGKKRVSLKGRATQTYEKLPSGEYGIKGLGEITEIKTGKVTKVDTRGIGIKQKGGFDVVSSSKVTGGKKTTFFEDLTLSAERIKEPTQVFDTISVTKQVGKPSRVTSGVTGEVYVETLFGKPGESIFRKTVKAESGRPVAVEQVLASDRFGISAKQFKTQFEGMSRQRDFSRMVIERESFRPTTVDSGVSVSKVKQVVKVEGMPQVTGQVLQQVAKAEAVSSLGKVKTAQVVKSASVGGVSVSGLSFPGVVQKATTKTSTVNLKPSLDSATVTKAGLDSSQVVDVLPKLQDKSAVRLRSRTISKVDTKTQPIVKTKPLTELKPMQQVKPYLEVKPYVSTKLEVASKQAVRTQPAFKPRPSFRPSPSFTPQPPPPPSSFFLPPILPAGQMYLPESTGKPVKTKGKIKTQYTPSVEALVFDIKASKLTKDIRIQSLTGLGLRPIKF